MAINDLLPAWFEDPLGGQDFLSQEMQPPPLDIPAMPGAAAPPTQQPPMQGPTAAPGTPAQGGGGFGDLAKILPLLALAGQRGGRAGIAAFLQGIQQAKLRKAQQDRLGQQDARTARVDQSNEDYRQQQLMLQADARRQVDEQRQQALLQQFGTALNGVDDPEAVRALLELYGGQADTVGIGRPALERYALQTATPSRLQKKAAEKKLAALKSQFGDKWLEQAAKFTYQMPGEEQPVPFATLLERAGMTTDPNAPAKAPASKVLPDVPLNLQHAAAVVGGNEELALGLESAMARQDATKRDPPRPPAATPDGLPPGVARRVDARVRGFDSLPIVKTTQKLAEAYTFASQLDPNTKNPADDQALIYAFAKAMDPDSVVREGEYDTVQKYAQDWASTFGFNAARIFSNTHFLTPQARANMKRTILTKYAAGKQQYDNVRRSYAGQINRITGKGDGEDYLTDYAGGFDDADPTDKTATPSTGSGVSYDDYLKSKGRR